MNSKRKMILVWKQRGQVQKSLNVYQGNWVNVGSIAIKKVPALNKSTKGFKGYFKKCQSNQLESYGVEFLVKKIVLRLGDKDLIVCLDQGSFTVTPRNSKPKKGKLLSNFGLQVRTFKF